MESSMENLIDFMKSMQKLKETKRKGWTLKDIPDPESVADHSFGVAILSMATSSDLNVDEDKLIKMCLIEDIGESVIGDITPHDDISEEEKIKKEKRAVKELADIIGNEEILSLWEEYVEGQTKEAKIAQQLDKVEMALQTLNYEEKHGKKEKMKEFYNHTEKRLENSKLKEVFKEIKRKRNEIKGIKLHLYTDGASRGNPGESGIGIVAVKDDKILYEDKEYIETHTNNEAEYRAVIKALELAERYEASEISLTSDSELMVRQLNGRYDINAKNLRELYEQVKEKEKNFKEVKYDHAPRENHYIERADKLANEAINERS